MRPLAFSSAALIGLTVASSGCGLLSSDGFFPTLSFSVPDSTYEDDLRITLAQPRTGTRQSVRPSSNGTDIAGRNPNGPLGRMADRMEKAVDQANRVLERLNEDGVEGEGTFTGKGPDGNISGKVTTLSDDEDYAYEAVICADGEAFQRIRWSEDKAKVEVLRDFTKTPVPGGATGPEGESALVGLLTYDASDADAVTTVLQVTGEPWKVPSDISDSWMVGYEKGITHSDGEVFLSGVNDWYSDSYPAEAQGQDYIIGRLDGEGTTGASVGYRETDGNCEGLTFDESNPVWCLGKEIGSGQGATTTEELAEIGQDLLDAGVEVASKELLEEITFPSDLSCE